MCALIIETDVTLSYALGQVHLYH